MLPNVIFEINRSGLGQVAYTDDGIMGLMLFGDTAAIAPQAIYSIEDAEALNIKEAGDYANAWIQLTAFYEEAGAGTKLWIAVAVADKMSDAFTSDNVKNLASAADGAICVLGVARGNSHSAIIVDGLNEDVILSLTKSQTLAEEMEALIKPLNFVIEGVGLNNADSTPDLKQRSDNRVSILLAAAKDDGVASMGQFIGRLAKSPVQRKASRVKSGALKNLTAHLTDGGSIEGRDGALGTLHDKGYIVYRSFPTKAGFFFSGDPTATASTDDLNIIARNRIIDKVIKISYNHYVNEVDDDVDIDDAGHLHSAIIAGLKAGIENQVKENMIGEISNFVAIIDPNQNILGGTPFIIELQITPKGYLGVIKLKIGFTNPYNN